MNFGVGQVVEYGVIMQKSISSKVNSFEQFSQYLTVKGTGAECWKIAMNKDPGKGAFCYCWH